MADVSLDDVKSVLLVGLYVAAICAPPAGFFAFMMWWLDYYAHQRQAR